MARFAAATLDINALNSQPEKYAIPVKVIDLLGNDAMKRVEGDVK